MKKFILPAIAAAAIGLAFLPSPAQASWLSQAIHAARGDYDYNPVYAYPPDYDYGPVYSNYAAPVYDTTPPVYDTTPPVYDYSPPVYYSQNYYVTPNYYPLGYGGYRYSPHHHDGGHGRSGHGGHGGHGRHH